MTEQLDKYLRFLYEEVLDDPMYAPDIFSTKQDFEAGWEACKKYLTTFEKGEIVEVTTPDHINSNTWFKREFVQKDSDGKYACKGVDGHIGRWDFIRKIEK